MNAFITIVLQKIESYLRAIASVALILMMLVVVFDILGRTLGWWFVLSTVEQTTLYMMILGFLGLASCFRDEGNIVVDIATQHLSPKSVRRIDAFWAFVAAVIFIPLAYMALTDGITLHNFGQRSEMLHISPLVHHTIAAFGLFMAALVSIAECLKLALSKKG